MPKQCCPCCGWTILLGSERPNVLAACSNCGQVVLAPGIPSCEIPVCGTDALIDEGAEGNPPQDHSVPLLHPALCLPSSAKHVASSALKYAAVGLLCIGLSIFFVVSAWRTSLPQSLLLLFLCIGMSGMFSLSGILLLYHGYPKLFRLLPAQLLSQSRLPPEAKQLGAPLALHPYVHAAPPGLLLFIGGFLTAAAAASAILLWRGEIKDERIVVAVVCGLLAGVTSLVVARCCVRLQILVCSDGFVVLRDREAGAIWRWEDINNIRIRKISKVPPLYSYTLRRKDGETFAFDHHIEDFANQFGVRVQQTLCRLMLPQLLSRLDASEIAAFGPLRVSREGLHHVEGFASWKQVANLTLDGEKLTIRKWGGNYGNSWSVSYPAIPNLAVFYALAQQLLRECNKESKNALSMLAARSNSLDATAIQANSTNFQPPPLLVESHSDCLQRQCGLQ